MGRLLQEGSSELVHIAINVLENTQKRNEVAATLPVIIMQCSNIDRTIYIYIYIYIYSSRFI